MLEIITMISKIRNSLKFLFDLFASRIASSALIKKFFFENRNKKKNHIAKQEIGTIVKIVSTVVSRGERILFILPLPLPALIRKSSNDNWISPHLFR